MVVYFYSAWAGHIMYHLKTMYYWSLNLFQSSLKIHFHMKGTVEKYNQIIA